MSIFVRIWLAFALILVLGCALTFRALNNQVKPSARQVVEDTLADSANLMSAMIASDVVEGKLSEPEFDKRIQLVIARQLGAHIWHWKKQRISQQIIITDIQGVVIYDSSGLATGQNYARWNDIYLTLQGRYGVRSTLSNPKDPNSSVMHVAAPITSEGKLVGVLSLSKPNSSVAPFVDQARAQSQKALIWLVVLSLVLSAMVAWWLRRSINQVRRYALNLADPDQPPPNFTSASELNELAASIGSMRQSLEDRAYVEQYMLTLTHELKSPLSAIRASSELLEEPLDTEDRLRFTGSIRTQTERLQALVERLLLLSKLEQGREALKLEELESNVLVSRLVGERHSLIQSKGLVLVEELAKEVWVSADQFWLAQAIGNLIDNAINHTPTGGKLTVRVSAQADRAVIEVINDGPCIPEFALSRVFERYFSLAYSSLAHTPSDKPFVQNTQPELHTAPVSVPANAHPVTKGTGIGLTLAKAVADRHQATLSLTNRLDASGAQAYLSMKLLSR